ncbi:hypothetical protein DICPUDRAFT_57346 [Dictyostelium purpureum]|uniref:N-acetyltransferase domain-containing protein n=1 Tax=Dictyostelium purpureum TaxID=5786 RepID=F0ZVL4_DICPU|nr:uncharacterized protein DICPUDRAFT_57346 [Dictyostelium purpureum]EGC32001.1 hypothetical protein DICPUDRAFT_57346 [Dictyostelium purpureum]|eukprot:XP_003291457.1 hypothetical protein DICPUDRAFT_57346 [Dictyostelium purpureum]
MQFDFSEGYPVLETERLIIKRITREHSEDLFVIRSDAESMAFVPRPLAKTIDDVNKWIDECNKLIDSKDMVNFGFFLKETGKIIGIIGYVRMKKEHFRGEIGYICHSKHHRKGYTSEAFDAVVEFGFKVLKFHTIEAVIDATNEKSLGLISKKNGFKLEAQFRDCFYYEGKFCSLNHFCKLNPYE